MPVIQLQNALIASDPANDPREPFCLCPVIWFDAWKYQNEDAPVVALIHEIRNAFAPAQQLWRCLKDGSQNVIEASLLSSEKLAEALGPLATVAKFSSKFIENYKKSKEASEKASFSLELNTERIQRLLAHDVKVLLDNIDFKKLIEKKNLDTKSKSVYPPSNRRLVIIIDDLDRCEPAMAAKTLEGIKVFLDIPGCVFVLGVNEERLIEHVATLEPGFSLDKPEGVSPARHRATDYLDKIINRRYALGIIGSRKELAQLPQLIGTAGRF